MTDIAKNLLERALQLSVAEQHKIAFALMDSLGVAPDIWDIDDEGFLDELDRRANDGSEPISWDEVKAKRSGEHGSGELR